MIKRGWNKSGCPCRTCSFPVTARARLIEVQTEVNSLFTDVHASGRNGRNVHEALVSLREVLKAIDNAIPRMGRI